ncbi:MAG TPA: efflux transporter outer membrane subunit [Steroidobacteraceae bacterium]|jgi:NodT family efflux transporter outer membrane factor (OMF) lipoprotein|nr:efflux transporter outer membrane subunit [Steroidobacteraceae bacterium]
MRAIGFAPVAAALLLGGCTVGPSYRGPPTQAGATNTAFVRAGGVPTRAAPPVARWWTTLQDPELDRLVALAVAGSPDVQEAEARLRSSRAVLAQQAAGLLPTTGFSGAYVRTRNLTSLLGGGSGSGGGGGGGMNLYALGLDASWEADIFGGQRRAIEGARAAAQGSQASLADVLVSLSAEVAQAYVGLRDAQQRLALTQRDLDAESRLVDLYNLRRRAGTASDLDLERIANQVDTTRATLAPLRAEVDVQLDRLSVLAGRPPGALDGELGSAAPGAPPAPPAQVAIGDPVAMLRRRPDIVVAERRLAQQTAAIGQAVAAQFPQVRLLGEVGFASLSPGTLFNGNNFSYIVAPILQWTPWDFGRNRARIAQARAGRDEAEAQYRAAVLAALQDAESSLAQYGEARNAVLDLARTRDSAERVYTMTQLRLRGGTADTTDVLDADTRRIQAELSYEQGLAQLTQYYVTLQKSLGLGWSAD